MADNKNDALKKKKRTIQYDRWGYFFIAPFFLIYFVFSLIPLLTTFVYSFFEYYRHPGGLKEIGPNFKVYKYFDGDYDDFNWAFSDVEVALDEIVYNSEDNTLTIDFKDEMKSSLEAYEDGLLVGTFDIDGFCDDIEELISAEVKKDGTKENLVETIKPLITKQQWALAKNIGTVFASNDNLGKYFWNTFVMWIFGFIPQILVSLMLAVWFTNTELRLKFQQFFKTVIYLPNLIMAAAFAMLFVSMLSPNGPVNNILKGIYRSMNEAAIAAGTLSEMEPVRFFTYTGWARGIVALMNFLMWYGNTTILLMAGVMGIDNSLFEAARIDGASSLKIFFKITIPLLLPIFVYVMITSLIGGIQMFDVPQILSNGNGAPNRTTMTIIMKLNKYLYAKNYGPAGITSIFIFAITGVLSGIVYKMTMQNYQNKR